MLNETVPKPAFVLGEALNLPCGPRRGSLGALRPLIRESGHGAWRSWRRERRSGTVLANRAVNPREVGRAGSSEQPWVSRECFWALWEANLSPTARLGEVHRGWSIHQLGRKGRRILCRPSEGRCEEVRAVVLRRTMSAAVPGRLWGRPKGRRSWLAVVGRRARRVSASEWSRARRGDPPCRPGSGSDPCR